MALACIVLRVLKVRYLGRGKSFDLVFLQIWGRAALSKPRVPGAGVNLNIKGVTNLANMQEPVLVGQVNGKTCWAAFAIGMWECER